MIDLTSYKQVIINRVNKYDLTQLNRRKTYLLSTIYNVINRPEGELYDFELAEIEKRIRENYI